MSQGLTKKELDEQFERFLKESVSDDSVDLGASDKQLGAQSRLQSVKKPWWEEDEHDGGGTESVESTTSRFLKAKKPENSRVFSEEPCHKPVPKPRVKALDKTLPADNSCKHKVSQRRRNPAADSSSDSLSSPTHENLHCLSGERSPAGSADSQTKEESEDDSVMVPAADTTNIGLDTLREEEEKARFFSQLEAGASSTIDYSKLIRELDSSSSTVDVNLRKPEEGPEQNDDAQRKAGITESHSPGSPHYSDDFEEEENDRKPLEEESKMCAIFANVSLHDSLNENAGEDRKKDLAESLERGPPYVQSGNSEMEALHEAYTLIHAVGDSDDQNQRDSFPEERGRTSRPVSPSQSPSLQPASTTESDIPTAEELMKRIHPETDHVSGFTVQPVSVVKHDQDSKTPLFSESTHPNLTFSKSPKKQPGPADPGVEIKETERLSPQDPSNHNLTWSIRQEVERLIGDQDKYSSPTSSQIANNRKQKHALRSAVVSYPSTSPVRKPTVASGRGRRVEGRPAVTPKSTGPSRSAAAARTSHSVSRPLPHPQEKAKLTKSQEKMDDTEPGLKMSNELVASVQSLVTVLQQQINTSSHQETRDTQETGLTHHPPKENREEENSQLTELRFQLAQRESELQLMKGQAEELNSLQQQNYLLQSKLRSAEEVSQRKIRAEAGDSSSEERLQQMHKEIKEQEMLLKGYHQENEKLYLQMKAQQSKSKDDQDAMFKENQRLLNELSSKKERLTQTSRPVGNVCLMDHSQRITDLLAQINRLQTNETQLSGNIDRLQREKHNLDVELELMKKERDLSKAQAESSSGDEAFEIRLREDAHRKEVASLQKKLQWFAENQELLDRDAYRLKTATAEVLQLKEQVEKLKQEVGRRNCEQQRKAKGNLVDTKRMQELERQVKDLQQILRHRNPNSLPALIYAAATAGNEDHVESSETSPPSRITALLERNVQRLESELKSHDEEAKRSLRTMEQQFQRLKLSYDQQISELEQQLEQKQTQEVAASAAATEPLASQVQTLEEELQRMKETHQETEKSLLDQIRSLQQQLKNKVHVSPGRHQHHAEAAVGLRIERLNQELSAKTRRIQDLNRTVDRLQKERRDMLSVPRKRPEARSTESKRERDSEKTPCSDGGEETFPAADYEKDYQPNVFSGSHISDVLKENQALKQDLEQLGLQSEKDKEALKAEAVQAREELRRLQERFTEELSSLKAEHLRVLDQLRATHALEHSSSKVAQLTNNINTQEVTMKHLQDQLRELQGTKDALAISRTREEVLQKQLTRLLTELKEAKDAQNPEVKLLCGLERKILNMELRHQHREKELQQVIGSSWQTLDADHQSEVELWKRAAQDKSRELEAFRQELDSILDILRHLQRQGVVMPPHGSQAQSVGESLPISSDEGRLMEGRVLVPIPHQ